MATQPQTFEGERFDQPLVVPWAIEAEPERYIAEKPYDLTKFEFAILRRRTWSEFWFSIAVGATAGIALSVAGKALAALLEKKTPAVDSWELWAIAGGAILSILLRSIRSKDDKERTRLEEVIDGHFMTNRPRRLHLTNNKETK